MRQIKLSPAELLILSSALMSELGFTITAPSVIREDNQACVAMVRNHSVSGRNRHFCLKMAWLREQVAKGVIQFMFVASKNNVADIFTKILVEVVFLTLRDLLQLLPEGRPNAGGVSK